MTFFFQTNPIRVIFKIVLALSSSIMTWAGGVQQVKSSQIKVRTFILKRASHGSGGWIKASCNRYAFVRKKKSIFKGVVDCFFSRLDCVYGVQSSMCSCLVFLKTHSFSHNLPLFHTSLSLLWQTPRFISWFYEAPPSENAMGWDWLAGSVCCDSLNHQYASERPAPRLSGMRSGWIVNSGVVYNAYQFEPDWDPEDISEEDRAEPVQARLLMVCLVVVVSYF